MFLFPVWLLCTAFRLCFIPLNGCIRDEVLLMGRLAMLWIAVFLVFALPAWSDDTSWIAFYWNFIIGVIFVLLALGPFVRSVILNWGFTTNSPLEALVDSTFTDKCLANINIPTFA